MAAMQQDITIPVRVVVTGGPLPIIPAPDLQSASWWQWLLTTILSLAVTVGVLIGHPFNSIVLSSAVPTAGLLAAALSTVIQVHGVHTVKVAAMAYRQAVHVKMLELHAAQEAVHAVHEEAVREAARQDALVTTDVGITPADAPPDVPAGTVVS